MSSVNWIRYVMQKFVIFLLVSNFRFHIPHKQNIELYFVFPVFFFFKSLSEKNAPNQKNQKNQNSLNFIRFCCDATAYPNSFLYSSHFQISISRFELHSIQFELFERAHAQEMFHESTFGFNGWNGNNNCKSCMLPKNCYSNFVSMDFGSGRLSLSHTASAFVCVCVCFRRVLGIMCYARTDTTCERVFFFSLKVPLKNSTKQNIWKYRVVFSVGKWNINACASWI